MNITINLVKTLKVRVKDKHMAILNRMAFEANQVWNAANAETSEWCYIPVPEVGYIRNHISAFDLQKWLKGIRKERDFIIPSSTFQEVIAVHAKARKQFKTDKLKWRASSGARRALGFVPFKAGAAKWVNGQVRFAGFFFKVWDSYGLSQYQFRSGSFSEDARGRWYFNIVVEVKAQPTTGQDSIGIDLGLKDTASCSNGEKLEAGRFYRDQQDKLATAQRARKKKRVKAIHAKIAHRRKDSLHKFSRKLVNQSGEIYVGNVKSSSLTKTKMAKSVLDAGWSMLKIMLKYKCDHAGVVFKEVDEKYTTQTCSCCGALPDTRPRGIAGLGIREWVCSACGVMHDRDVNAAKNILAVGHGRLVAGIPCL